MSSSPGDDDMKFVIYLGKVYRGSYNQVGILYFTCKQYAVCRTHLCNAFERTTVKTISHLCFSILFTAQSESIQYPISNTGESNHTDQTLLVSLRRREVPIVQAGHADKTPKLRNM